jgi:hypothetical protein
MEEPAPIQYNKRAYAKLNQYDYSPANMERIRAYVLHGVEPGDLTPRKLATFKRNFSPQDWHFDDNTLIFTQLDLTVVLEDQLNEVLTQFYANARNSLGSGINSFYASLQKRYLNITKKQAQEWLQGKAEYQVTKKPVKMVTKALIADYPNHRWSVDQMDVSAYTTKNRGFKYILNGVDYFSRKVFSIGIKRKTAPTVRQAIDLAVHNYMADTYPETLISDGGLEFALGDWFQEHNVHHAVVESHVPQYNGIIEQINGASDGSLMHGFCVPIRSNGRRYWYLGARH